MESVSLEGLLRQYINNSINGLSTSMPARIERVVSLPEQRIDVQLLVDRVTPEGGTLKHPVVLNVPLIYPGSITSQFSFPVQVGDTVLCVFSQRSIQRFKLGANENHEPLDFAKYSRNDAMALPGLFGFNHAVNNPSKRSLEHSVNDTVIAHNIGTDAECEVRLKANGDVSISSPGQVEVNCKTSIVNAEDSVEVKTSDILLDADSTTITGSLLVEGLFTYTSGMLGSGSVNGDAASISGSINASQDVVAGNISLTTHVHGDSPPPSPS